MEQDNNSLGKRIVSRIKYALGFYKNPAYVEEKLLDADVGGMRFLGIIVALVEIAMIIRYAVKYGDQCETAAEFFSYTYGY